MAGRKTARYFFHDLLNERGEKVAKSRQRIFLLVLVLNRWYLLSLQPENIEYMAVKIEKWVAAQKKHRLSDKHVQMARELGLNPDKLGKIDNHKQETWKAPLPQFIERIYFKRFKREEPAVVRSLKEIIADDKAKKEKKKIEKAKRPKNDALPDDGNKETENLPKPLSLSAKLKQLNAKPKVRVRLESSESPDSILSKEAHIFDEAFDFYEKESVTFSELGFILKKIHPRYKPRRYGCKTLKAIYEKLDKYEVVEVAGEAVLRRKEGGR